jgi:hypothetical protein
VVAVAGELTAHSSLLLVSAAAARCQRWVPGDRLAPALDAAGSLEPRDSGDEVPTCQVVRRRERTPSIVERRLLGYRRPAKWAASCDAQERSRRSPKLLLDDGTVIHGLSAYRAVWRRQRNEAPVVGPRWARISPRQCVVVSC